MITPSKIAHGLAAADREILATLLSLFEESDLPAMLFDSGKDLVDSVSNWFTDELESKNQKHVKNFEKRIQDAKNILLKQSCSEANMRLRLWIHLRHALDLEADLTFSNSGIESITEPFDKAIGEVSNGMAESEEFKKLSIFSSDYWEKRTDKVVNIFKGNKKKLPTLHEVVTQNVLRLVVAAEKTDEIPPEARAQILKSVREKISNADSDLQSAFFNGGRVEDLTEDAALKLLVGGGGLIGVGIAVELAGFSAYILAAQASAVIPLVGGQTLVSSLAVLANPILIVPAILGGGAFLSGSVKKKILASFAITAATILILRAISEKKEDAKELTSAFSKMPHIICQERLKKYHEDKYRNNSSEILDGTFSLMKNAGGWVKNKIITDAYPELKNYLDKYYELKG